MSLQEIRTQLAEQQHNFAQGSATVKTTQQLTKDYFSKQGNPVNDSDPQLQPRTSTHSWQFQGDKWRYVNSPEEALMYDGKSYYVEAYAPEPSKPAPTQPHEVTRYGVPISQPMPLDFGYQLEGKWWNQILNDGSFQIIKEEESPLTGHLLYLKGTLDDGRDCEAWFSQDLGLMVKVLVQVPNDDQYESFELTGYTRHGPVVLPTKGENLYISNGSNAVRWDNLVTFSDWSTDTQPDSAFTFTLANGDLLKDDKSYVLMRKTSEGMEKVKNIHPTSPSSPSYFFLATGSLLGACVVIGAKFKKKTLAS